MAVISYDAKIKSKSLLDFTNGADGTDALAAVAAPVVDTKLFELTEKQGDDRFDEGNVYLRSEKTAFEKEKQKLRQYFKQLKVGLIKIDDIPEHYRGLLFRYYGYDEQEKRI